jgi:hypothetical protein
LSRNLASRYINISAREGIDLGGLGGEFRQSDIDSGQDPDDVFCKQMERNLVKRLFAWYQVSRLFESDPLGSSKREPSAPPMIALMLV